MSEYWQNKKAVVCGGRGMVGKFLVDLLLEAGAKVTVMDTGARGKGHNPYARYIDVRQADVSKEKNCAAVFRGKDAVFNLAAAVGGVYYNLSHQIEQFYGNLRLLVPPVIAAAQVGVPTFVQTSTVCVYADGYNAPAREEFGQVGEPEPANAGYAWAKRQGERACEWAFANTSTRWAIVRPTNMYAENDYFDERAHVIPALIRKFASGMDPVKVFGGSQQREFLHAQDGARGMMAVAELAECGGIYNLGTGGETMINISGLACLIRELVGSDTRIEYDPTQPTGDQHRYTDVSRAWALLGWKHTIGLREGLERTVKAYMEKHDGQRPSA